MADFATKDQVQEIVYKAVDDLSQIIQSFARNVDDRFNTLETKVDSLEVKVDTLEAKTDTLDMRMVRLESGVASLQADVTGLNTKYEHLISTLDTFLKRLDDMEVNNVARDAQLARLERWIEQVAAKTGVKLEY
jgi:chromosome segregation ATPase